MWLHCTIGWSLVFLIVQQGDPAQADCVEPPQDRLGCFSWWKWDTADHCTQRGCCADEKKLGKWCHFPNPKANVTKVHVIQGCHLDVGFKNTSQVIVNEWFSHHLPMAAAVGKELDGLNTTAQLHFTAPAWIVSLFLDCPIELPIACPNASTRALVLDAIKRGWITWHAFPFNGLPSVSSLRISSN